MIIGVGVDLCDSRRIAQSLDRFGQRFLDRCFTKAEQEACAGHALQAAKLARRYAAKEAAAKALGTGIGELAWLTEIEVASEPNGKPVLHLHERTADTFRKLMPEGMTGVTHISITDEGDLAQAFVVLEARPAG